MTYLLFCEHLDTLLAEGNFFLDLYLFKIFSNFFQFFIESFFFEELFFHNFRLKYYFKIHISGVGKY